jgi:L-rhamnose-H+ transport protein
MAFAIAASGEIDKVAQDYCSNDIFQGLPGLVVIMAGGFTVNFVWCLILNLRNRTTRDYVSGGKGLPLNYLLSGLAGVIWYFQFFFYTMGSTRLGEYRFSSWPIHMSFIIVFSNLWGIYFKEWKGTSRRTHALVWAGILILAASTFVIGYGNHLKSFETAGQ